MVTAARLSRDELVRRLVHALDIDRLDAPRGAFAQAGARHPQLAQQLDAAQTSRLLSPMRLSSCYSAAAVQLDVPLAFLTTTDLTAGQWLIYAAVGTANLWSGRPATGYLFRKPGKRNVAVTLDRQQPLDRNVL